MGGLAPLRSAADPATLADFPRELRRRRRVILSVLSQRVRWFIRLRWAVPPVLAVATLAGHAVGLRLPVVPLLLIALFVLLYNAGFQLSALGRREYDDADPAPLHRFTYGQMALDYGAMLALMHWTGGAASPVLPFAILHIIFAAILLPARAAYAIAGVVVVATTSLGAAEHLGFIDHHPVALGSEVLELAPGAFPLVVALVGFAAAMVITSFATTSIVAILRKRIYALADLSETAGRRTERLSALYAMTQAIGSERSLDKVLGLVTAEVTQVMGVQGASVKLLSDDGQRLRYAAVHGLPDALRDRVVELARSPLNRRIIEGEPYVDGHFDLGHAFQYAEALAEAGVRSVVFVPLVVQERVIGILGAYCRHADRFDDEAVRYFRLVADLVAIAVDNARAYEAVEHASQERSRFMRRVAHDLRAPLAAIASMLDLLRGEYLGTVSPKQGDYLGRIDRRARAMLAMVNELLTLAASRRLERGRKKEPIGLAELAARIGGMFAENARQKGVQLRITVAPDLPPLMGEPSLIEALCENLLSNAVKYTRSGGDAEMRWSRQADGLLQLTVSDTGIGIPEAEQAQLFTEFFRASNARQVDEIGTGLGLAIVKEVVDRHGGRIAVVSKPSQGTTFTVTLPSGAPADPAAAPRG